jgi:glutathione S-transferase
MPFGKTPVLEIDGVRYGHSFAILNYLGKKLNLSGSTDLEDLELNGVGMFVYDLVTAIEDIGFYYKDSLGENLPKELLKLADEKFPFIFGKFEEIVAKNDGHFFRGKFSWVDIFFASKIEYFNSFLKYAGFESKADVIGNFPNLKKLYEKVFEQDGVKKWIEKRPKDPYFDLGKKL